MSKEEIMAKMKWTIIFLFGFLILWTGWGILSWYIWEKPDYKVLKKIGDVEIREYQQLSIISTVAADKNRAFSTLADYIFGENKQGDKISMTSPVMTKDSAGGVRMVFFMPKGYTPDNAPEPSNDEVNIGIQAGRTIATLHFSGKADRQSFKEHTKQLLKTLEKHQVKTKGEPFLLQYDDPWVPFFMRRNEACVEVIL